MTAKIRSRLTYANVVATLALFLLVAGGSVALGGAQSRQSAQVEQQLKHKLKVVKEVVKEVEAQQDTSDQQTQAKLDHLDNRIVDLHVFVANRLDTTLARLKALCRGQVGLNGDHKLHDDQTTVNWMNDLNWRPCRQLIFGF